VGPITRALKHRRERQTQGSEKDSQQHCGCMEQERGEGMLVASRSRVWPQLTASKEMGTSELQPQGTEYSANQQNELGIGFSPGEWIKELSAVSTLILVL